MDDKTWEILTADLASPDIPRSVAAAERLYRDCNSDDAQRLLSLLDSPSFVVREGAAWPLCSIVGPSVLPELFAAYQRGFDEGSDNDGFTTALVELADLFSEETKKVLDAMIERENGVMRGHAKWLLQFCADS